MWLTLLQRQRRDSQCNGLCRILSTGKPSVPFPSPFPTGMEIRGYHPGKFFKLAASQSPSKNCHVAAVEKVATRRLISRIILESVVNASSRRRRGIVLTRSLLILNDFKHFLQLFETCCLFLNNYNKWLQMSQEHDTAATYVQITDVEYRLSRLYVLARWSSVIY